MIKQDKKALYESIMNSVAYELKKTLTESTLNESRTPNSDIENYVKSWLKYPQNPQEMQGVIDSIIDGMCGAYAYREDEGYADQNTIQYTNASKYLKNIIDIVTNNK